MSMDLHAMQDTPDTGYFQANITSQRNSRPIAGAKIQIRNINYPNEIIEETETNSDGQSDVISLPAPPREYSLTPGAEQPYSTYSIQITAPNYEPVEINGAEILSGETALQNTAMLPVDDTEPDSEELFVISPHTLYEEYPPKIPEDEIKTVEETGEIVLSRVVIPAGVRDRHAAGFSMGVCITDISMTVPTDLLPWPRSIFYMLRLPYRPVCPRCGIAPVW